MNKHFTKLFRLSRPGFLFRKPLMTLPKPSKLGSFAVSSSLLTLLYLRQASQFSTKAESDVREVVALNTSDLQEGEMKEVQVGPEKDDVILISKFQGKYYATSAKCPHLAAPLAKGVLFGEKLLCPFHSASFSVVTGIPDEGPVFQGLTTYDIREDKGKLIVKVPKVLKSGADIPMVGRSKDDSRRFVILGAGPAALSAAETLRQSGYGGEIILITEDKNLPYDRTMLSKNIFHAELPKITLRNQEFYDKYGITILTGKHVSNVNGQKQTVEVDGLGGVKYDKLLVALGGKPWLPPIPGADFKNVFTLRSHDDMEKIRAAAQNAKNVVIVGGSFIGMESAASFKNEFKDKINITVIEGGNAPFERVLGSQVGGALQKFHEEKGVKFHLKAKAKAIEGGNGTAQQVILADGTKLAADIVILGTGVRPNSKPVANSVKLSEDGAVYTNQYLQSSDENIFAAGDVASVPYWYTDSRERIEHYNESIQQGQIAAYNMLGKKISHHATPFFWTRHYDKSLQYVGYAKHFDDIYIDGDLSKLDFIAYYGYKNKIVASASMGRSPAAMIINQAIQQRVMPSFEDVKSGKVKIDDIKKRVQQNTPKCQREACMHKAPTK